MPRQSRWYGNYLASRHAKRVHSGGKLRVGQSVTYLGGDACPAIPNLRVEEISRLEDGSYYIFATHNTAPAAYVSGDTTRFQSAS